MSVRLGALLLPPVILLAVIYFVCLVRIIDKYAVEIEMTAESADTLAFYWPNRSGEFEEALSEKIHYPSGGSSHEAHLVLGGFGRMLRIDPGVTDNTITIHRLIFSRFGSEEEMSGEDIAENIVRSSGASATVTDKGVVITFQEGDPQVVIMDFPEPLPPQSVLLALGIVLLFTCLIFSYLTRSLLQKTGGAEFQLNRVLGSSLLVIFGWMFRWPLYLMLPISLFFTYGILYAVIFLVRLKKERGLLLTVKPLLVTGGFLALLMLPMLMTLDPGTRFLKASSTAVTGILKAEGSEEGESRIRAAIAKLEESFKYRFPFRKDLINLNATTKIFGLGFSPSPKAIYGKDGMFFEGYGQRRVESDVIGSFDNITDYMGLIPFTQGELEKWLICLEERYYWLQERGIDYVFVLAPTKALVYPEKLPSRIYRMKEKVNRPTRYEQLVKYLKANSVVPVVDLRTPMLQAKEVSGDGGGPETLLYYRTDFHWNYYGSFLAYQAIIDEINRAYPKYGFDAAKLDEFTIHKRTDWVHQGFINALGLDPLEHRNETYLTFHPQDGSVYNGIGEFADKGINDYTIPKHLKKTFNKQRTRIRLLENSSGEVDSIFVIGDSFAEKYFGYFSGHAEKTINFRTVYSFFPDLFTSFSPDLVIQEVLNMYLLQKPPSNMPRIKQARVRALADQDNGQSVALKQ